MSRSQHANLTADQRAERRARRTARPSVRRTGTLAGILRMEERDTLDPIDAYVYTY
jgi:hypothetical protein